jgi:hypothetical protein
MHLQSLRASQSRKDNIVELAHVQAAITSVNHRISNANQKVTDEMLGAVLGVGRIMADSQAVLRRANLM